MFSLKANYELGRRSLTVGMQLKFSFIRRFSRFIDRV